MNKKWRPDNWEPLDCNKCQCREARCETWCTLYRTYEDAASAILSARDKWWLQQVERMGMSRNLETYVYGNDKFKDDYICIRFTDWQSLKQSILEVKE